MPTISAPKVQGAKWKETLIATVTMQWALAIPNVETTACGIWQILHQLWHFCPLWCPYLGSISKMLNTIIYTPNAMISNFHFCEIIFSFKIPKNWCLYCRNWCLNAKIGILNTNIWLQKSVSKSKKCCLNAKKVITIFCNWPLQVY